MSEVASRLVTAVLCWRFGWVSGTVTQRTMLQMVVAKKISRINISLPQNRKSRKGWEQTGWFREESPARRSIHTQLNYLGVNEDFSVRSDWVGDMSKGR